MADETMTKKVTDLTESTEPTDEDLFIAGSAGTASLRKIKWSSIWTKITAAILEKLVANNLVTTAAGFLLDARQGKILDDKYNELNTNLQWKFLGYTDGFKPIEIPSNAKEFYVKIILQATSKAGVIVFDKHFLKELSYESYEHHVSGFYFNESYHGSIGVHLTDTYIKLSEHAEWTNLFYGGTSVDMSQAHHCELRVWYKT